jgi:hypothetical protein
VPFRRIERAISPRVPTAEARVGRKHAQTAEYLL